MGSKSCPVGATAAAGGRIQVPVRTRFSRPGRVDRRKSMGRIKKPVW